MRTFVTAALASVILLVGACGDDEPTDAGGGPEPAPGTEQDAGPGRATDGTDDTDGTGDDGWAPRAPAPLALTEVAAAPFDGELWVVGGFAEDGRVVTTVQVYDPASDSWRAGPDLPDPVHHAALVATDDGLVLLGGYRDAGFVPVADVLVLAPDGPTWTPGPALPEPRGAGGAAWDGRRIAYGGGVGPDGLADDVWVLDDPSDPGWRPAGNLSVARDHLAAASDGDGRVWFLGGREQRLDANLGTVDLLVDDVVEPIGELPTPRGGVAAFHAEDHGACLAGGERPDATFGAVECIDADGSTTALPALVEPRHGLGAGVIDGVAYVALGGPEPRLAVSATIEALRVPAP